MPAELNPSDGAEEASKRKYWGQRSIIHGASRTNGISDSAMTPDISIFA